MQRDVASTYPSGHMTYIQRRINVDATLRCIDVNAMLHTRHVPAGIDPRNRRCVFLGIFCNFVFKMMKCAFHYPFEDRKQDFINCIQENIFALHK